MSYEEETECATAIFRCIDPIQNFKIRVILQPVKSRFIPVPNYESEKSASISDLPTQKEEGESEVEEFTFAWQEKVFSSSEISKYSNLSNCKTKVHEKYHREVTKIPNNSKRKLFTYVDVDNYKVKDEDVNAVEGGVSFISRLARKIDNLEISGSTMRSGYNVSKSRIVNYCPGDDFKNESHLINTHTQKMFIMADLKAKEGEDIKKCEKNNEEFVVCVIIYDPVNKMLKMCPPFSKEVNAKPYCIGVNGQYSKNAYHYWLHHASLQPCEEDVINERKIKGKLLQHQNEIRKLQIGNEFVGQSPNQINVTLLGEIISAQDFEYDGLLIHYVTKLSNGWYCTSPESLLGVTQTARTNDYGVAHFCHLFNIDLMFDLKYLEDFSAYVPEIFFEVLSMDAWKIYRNEGYAYVTLPRKPGVHDFKLKCWRPQDNTIKSDLDRFFLGGSQVLEDVSYVGIGERNENKRVISRFGFKTIPTGTIKLRLNVIHQSEAFKTDKDQKYVPDRNVFGKLDTSNLMGSVNAVLEAFRHARERMLKAKETLQAGDYVQI